MKRYDAVVTFFRTPEYPEPLKYISWLEKQVKSGRKVVIIGNFGAHTTDGKKWIESNDLNEFFYAFGLSFKETVKTDGEKIAVVRKDSSVLQAFPNPQPQFMPVYKRLSNQCREYLALQVENRENTRSSLIVRTPCGGMAQLDYLFIDSSAPNPVWSFDVAAFLKDSLRTKVTVTKKPGRLIGLFKGSEKQSVTDNFIRKFAAESLVKMGYDIDYFDIEKDFPSKMTMAGYKGIITWYESPEMKNATGYCSWLRSQMDDGKKIVILGNFGAYADKVSLNGKDFLRYLKPEEYNRFFYSFRC